MPLSCHNAVNEIKEHTQFTFALAGNPNVGKSSIFNRLTGMGVVTANYPGKTVELNIAATHLNGTAVGLVDLPGTYALGAVSEDQWVARQALLDHKLDGVIVILDATNLARNLYMLLQLIDMEFPVIVALNLVDQAEKIGIKTDIKKFSELIGVPVVPTVAIRGEGLHQLVEEAIKSVKSRNGVSMPYRYGQDVEQEIENLAEVIRENMKDLPFGLSPRAVSILLLEKDSQFIEIIKKIAGSEKVLESAEKAWNEITEKHGEDAHLRLIRERHGLAGSITQEVQEKTKKGTLQAQLMWKACISPFCGMFILAGVLASVFAFLFYAGGFLSEIFDSAWTSFIHPKLQYLIYTVFGNGILGKIVIWGPDAGIQAALSVGIPYVFTFYFILAFLEDSGYLNAMAFLTDRLMHRIGLHGRAALALIAGGGCNVPAIVGTRVLTTMRERIIASFLIVLTPCSARTAVIMGAVSLFVGWQWALSIYFISLALIVITGIGLNKLMPGKSAGLVMEMFPFRKPSLRTIMKKTWFRFKEFVFVAAPIILGGSLVLGALYETGLIWKLSAPMAPVVQGMLGLPAIAGLTLLFAVLRKELALQLLITLAMVQFGSGAENLLKFMTQRQIYVYTLVNTIYVPCVATIAVIGREIGWKRAVIISLLTTGIAVVIGTIANQVLIAMGY